MKQHLICLLLCLGMDAMAQPEPKSPIPIPKRPANLPAGQTPPEVTDIWVVFKTHCDIGYTKPAKEVLRDYRETMMDHAIKLIEADKKNPPEERFKWTIAGWPMWGDILGPLQTPERKAKVEQLIREGSICVHALPASMHSDAFEMEDYVRSLSYASKVARTTGLPLPISAKMTDVPAHSWFLPTLLKRAGVKFLQIGCNYSNRYPLLPSLFWWEGPDGSRVLCNYTIAYGSPLKPPADWPSKNYLAIMMTHDNQGPPSPKEVRDVRKGVSSDLLAATVDAATKKKFDSLSDVSGKISPQVKLHFASMEEFAKAVLAENPKLPVIKGDMVDPWIHGIMAMPVETKMARNIRPFESALEILNTQLKIWNAPAKPIAKELATAFENSFLFGEHTWGANTPGYGYFSMDGKNHEANERYLYNEDFVKARKEGYYKKFESSFDDHRQYIRTTDSIVSKEWKNQMALLAKKVRAKRGDIIVYNPLPWKRSGEVEVKGKRYLAENIPPSSFKVISSNTSKADTITSGIIHTKFFDVKVDTKRGGISSLIDKARHYELVEGNKYVLGQYLHERFSLAQTHDYYNRFCTMNNSYNATAKANMPSNIEYSTWTPNKWKMYFIHTETRDVIILKSSAKPMAKATTITFSFPNHEPFVEIEWKVKNKIPNTIPEAGWLCLPLAVAGPTYLAGRLGGMMDLSKDQITGGNRYVYAINTGVAIVGDKSVGICSPDAPLMSFGVPGIFKYNYTYFPKKPIVFLNLYNNMWNTNFPYWTEGSWSERVRIWPIYKKEKAKESVAVKSWETRLPLQGVAANGNSKGWEERSGLAVSRPGVIVTAFGEDGDGNKGTLLRVWEQAGIAGEVTVTLPEEMKVKTAQPVTLRGEKKQAKKNIVNGKFTFTIKQYAPASYILE